MATVTHVAMAIYQVNSPLHSERPLWSVAWRRPKYWAEASVAKEIWFLILNKELCSRNRTRNTTHIMPRPLRFPCLLILYWVVSPLGNPVPYYTLQGLKCILEFFGMGLVFPFLPAFRMIWEVISEWIRLGEWMNESVNEWQREGWKWWKGGRKRKERREKEL